MEEYRIQKKHKTSRKEIADINPYQSMQQNIM